MIIAMADKEEERVYTAYSSPNKLPEPSAELVSERPQRLLRLKNIIIDLRNTQYRVIRDICEKDLRWKVITRKQTHGQSYRDEQPNIIWTDSYISEDELRGLLPYQKINHFPGSFQLGNKHFLSKNISKMKKKFEAEYSFFPETWLMPDDFERFRGYCEKNKSFTWIFKPSASSQGKGIVITKNPDVIEQKLRNRKCQQFVVQRYIDKPYLIDGLKFDLRIYVLIKSFEPLKIFMYREGLARFATNNYEKPEKSNFRNSFMHLTNYAINKKNPLFMFSEQNQNEGHKRTFTSILKILSSKGENVDQLLSSIQDLIVKTVCSVQPLLSHLYKASSPNRDTYSQNCFEILGFDILVDETLKPHLLEVNHTPSFRTDSQLDLQVKYNLLRDTLQLIHITSKDKMKYQVKPSFGNRFENKNRVLALTKIQRIEKKHINGYIQLYPCAAEDTYKKFIDYSHLVFDIWTGIIKKNFAELANTSNSNLNVVVTAPGTAPTGSLQRASLSKKMNAFARITIDRDDSKRLSRKQADIQQKSNTEGQISRQEIQKIRLSLMKQRFQEQIIMKKQSDSVENSPSPKHISPNKTSLGVDQPSSPLAFHNFLHKRDLSASRRYEPDSIKQDLKTLLHGSVFSNKMKKSPVRRQYMSRPHMVNHHNYRALKLIEFPI